MMDDFLSYAIKTLIVYLFTYFAARILPSKTFAQMSAYDMAGIMLFTTVAAEPIVTKVTMKAIAGSGLIIVFMMITARLSLVNKLMPILEHNPLVIIEKGKIDMDALKASLINLSEFQGMLRAKGFENIDDIDHAILEQQGELSVFSKSNLRPLQPKDLNILPQAEGLTLPLIMDGTIVDQNLRHIGMTKEQLTRRLQE